MARKPSGQGGRGHRRVAFRRNRQQPARRKQWDVHPEDAAKADLDSPQQEAVVAKGALSRKRTVTDADAGSAGAVEGVGEGTAVAVRGRFVEVDDGGRVWLCTIRRLLRTRVISDRSPVVAGDRVRFAIGRGGEAAGEGVIEQVLPRRSSLQRSDGRRMHTLAANVDQVLVIGSIREPMIKPHLIDRYLVAAHAGNLAAAICINKVDLDAENEVAPHVERYRRLGYPALAVSAVTGAGVDELRTLLTGKSTLLAGQSGVGKSSLLNAVQPGLNLRTGSVSAATEKGRHTTTTAVWLRLAAGGAVVDTPGIRALDVAMVPLDELEMHFVEFVDLVQHCRFPNCVHIHEEGCAIQAAVESGQIDLARYDSYVELFYELSEVRRKRVSG